MVRDKAYFEEVLKGYRTDLVRKSSDIDELISVIWDKHARKGCGLSQKNDVPVLRECIRECMDRNNGAVTTSVNKIIESIDPMRMVQPKNSFNAYISENLLTPENIGGLIPVVTCKTLCNIYEEKKRQEGIILSEEEKFNEDSFNKSDVGKGLSLFASLLAKNLAAKIGG